ncbi:hypothetical protein GCM10023166_28630 [Paeniglutamicibacter cryotolerans]
MLHAGVRRLAARFRGTQLPAGWSPETSEIRFQHRPGAGVSGLYAMPPGSDFAFIGASTEPLSARRGLARVKVRRPVTGEKLTVSAWRDPDDPHLPGLAAAQDAHGVAARWADGDRLLQLHTLAYRPLRRAVIRARFETRGPVHAQRTLFLKVLRPGQDMPLVNRHMMLGDAGLPVPAVVGEPYRHIVALTGMPGESLGRALHLDGAAGMEPARLADLLDALPPEVMGLLARPAWSDKLQRYAQAATATLPGEAAAIRDLAARIEDMLAGSDRGPLVPAHGDFYEANLLVSKEAVRGLLDLDSLGPGYRVDDLACLLGHMAVMPSLGGTVEHLSGALERFGTKFAEDVDPAALWARSAAVAVSLIAGARTPGRAGWEPAAVARLAAARSLLSRV